MLSDRLFIPDLGQQRRKVCAEFVIVHERGHRSPARLNLMHSLCGGIARDGPPVAIQLSRAVPVQREPGYLLQPKENSLRALYLYQPHAAPQGTVSE